MTKKLCQLVLTVVFVVGLAVWPAPAAGQADLTLFLTAVRSDTFPEIQVDLRAINANSQVVNNLSNASLAITEGGVPVKDFKITPNTNGAVHLVFMLDLDVYNSYTYQPGVTELRSAFTTLVTGGYFVDDRDTVQVVARINKGSDQTVELLPPTHKGLDLTKWVQGYDFKVGTQRTNGLLGVDETIKQLASSPDVGQKTTAIIYVGRNIGTLPAAVASSAATGYAQEAKDAHILLYAFHTGGPGESDGALNTLANGSGGTYIRIQRGSVGTAVSGIFGSINSQRALYTLSYRSTVGTSGKREIKVAPTGVAANSPQVVTTSYDIKVQSPVIKITAPAAGTPIKRAAGGGSQVVTVSVAVDSWPDGHPRQLKTGVLTVNGQAAAHADAPNKDGVYEFEWDISGITQPGEHAMSLDVTVTEELGQQATASATVNVEVATPATEPTDLAPTAESGQATTSTPDPCVANPAACKGGTGGGVPWLWIGLGVVLLVVLIVAVVVLIFVVSRMRGPAAAAAPARSAEEYTGSETIMVEAARPQVTLGQIRILQGPPDVMGRTIDITRSTTVLGRAPQGADIVFYADDDRSVISRRHCTLDCDGMAFTITDHSANGTSINGVRLQRDVSTQLEDGAEVLLGSAGDQLGVKFAFSNMLGKTQLWSPGSVPGGARGGEGGATMLKGDMSASSGARAPAAAPRPGIAPWMIIVGVAAVLVLLAACGGIVAVGWYVLSTTGQTPALTKPTLTLALPATVALVVSATPKKASTATTPVKSVSTNPTKTTAPPGPTDTSAPAATTAPAATKVLAAATVPAAPALCNTGQPPVRKGNATYKSLTVDGQLFTCGTNQACLALQFGNSGALDYSIQVDKSNGAGKALVMQGAGFDFVSVADPAQYGVFISVPAGTPALSICLQFNGPPKEAKNIIFQWLVEGSGAGTALFMPLTAP